MENFEFYAPTNVLFGKDTELKVGALVKEQNCKKVLVHFGGSSAQKSGLLDRIYRSLDEAGISYVSLGGVVPNPRLSKVREGIALCQKEGVDFLLGVGGGSVLDSCKAIGYGLANPDVDVWDLYLRTKEPKGCYPVGAVLTIAAAGSEMSNSSVITNEEGWLKRSCNTNYGRCKFAIMNPELTYTLPQYQTQSGCTDILMHTMERYFTNVETMELTDVIAEALMRNVIRNAQILMKDPKNYEARAQIMWAGSLAHNDLTGCGSIGDYASHQIEHELGGLFDVTHGAGLAAIWGSWARHVYKHDVKRFAQFAVNVLGVYNHFDNPERTALEGIEAMEKFYRSIEMPISCKELLNGHEITNDEIELMADKCTSGGTKTVGNFVALNKQDVSEIFKMAK